MRHRTHLSRTGHSQSRKRPRNVDRYVYMFRVSRNGSEGGADTCCVSRVGCLRAHVFTCLRVTFSRAFQGSHVYVYVWRVRVRAL